MRAAKGCWRALHTAGHNPCLLWHGGQRMRPRQHPAQRCLVTRTALPRCRACPPPSGQMRISKERNATLPRPAWEAHVEASFAAVQRRLPALRFHADSRRAMVRAAGGASGSSEGPACLPAAAKPPPPVLEACQANDPIVPALRRSGTRWSEPSQPTTAGPWTRRRLRRARPTPSQKSACSGVCVEGGSRRAAGDLWPSREHPTPCACAAAPHLASLPSCAPPARLRLCLAVDAPGEPRHLLRPGEADLTLKLKGVDPGALPDWHTGAADAAQAASTCVCPECMRQPPVTVERSSCGTHRRCRPGAQRARRGAGRQGGG